MKLYGLAYIVISIGLPCKLLIHTSKLNVIDVIKVLYFINQRKMGIIFIKPKEGCSYTLTGFTFYCHGNTWCTKHENIGVYWTPGVLFIKTAHSAFPHRGGHLSKGPLVVLCGFQLATGWNIFTQISKWVNFKWKIAEECLPVWVTNYKNM